MGLFGNTTDSSIVEDVEQATSDKVLEEDWQLIMNICDKAGKSSEDAKAWLRAIVKRLYNSDPHIGLKAVTLLDACVKNSGKIFHVEVASREFENDFNKLMTKAHSHVAKKLRESLKRWSENEFKSDGQLSLIPSLYHKLRGTYDFSASDSPKKKAPNAIDPNAVESQEEEEQILKAIELSLKETTGSPKNTSSPQPTSSLYPAVNNMSALSAVTASTTPAKEPRKVRALYDFEAAEDNELTFSSGEIIMILDDSDLNWWRGSNQRGEGLFPANFVTADLSVEPEKILFEKAKKVVQFKDDGKVVEKDPEEIQVNEDKINRLLHLLHEADPTNPETDTDELLSLEREVNAMGPLIDSELELVDRKHAQLTQLSTDLVDALGLYHTLMREPHVLTIGKAGYEPIYGYLSPAAANAYNGTSISQHLPPSAMGCRVPFEYEQQIRYHMGMPPQVSRPPMVIPPNSPGGMVPTQQTGVLTNSPSGLSHRGVMPGQPHELPPNLPPDFSNIGDERRMDGSMMTQYSQGMSNCPLPQPSFPNSGPTSQTTIQNDPNQQPSYVTSSTHIMH